MNQKSSMYAIMASAAQVEPWLSTKRGRVFISAFNAPGSLGPQGGADITAYILSLNKVIGPKDVVDAKTLPKVKMPNHDNFIIKFPDRI